MAGWKMFAIVLPIFLVLDFLWLGVLMKGFYNQELGDLARRQDGALAPRWPAAILVYVLIPAGVVFFVRPMLGAGVSLGQSFALGAAFGCVVYGVYDLTNLAVIDKWTVRMTAIDIAWGSLICGLIAIVMKLVDGRSVI
jgi:uncharacterized membrane protein